EQLDDAAWEDLIGKKLFGPLGMKSAGFGAMGTKGKVDQPWQHEADGTPIEPGPHKDNPEVMGPAATVHCSLPDWGKFVADQLRAGQGDGALLKAETYRLLRSSPFKDEEYRLGGWFGVEERRAGGLVLDHAGSNNHNLCTAWLAPGRNFAVLVATNQGG